MERLLQDVRFGIRSLWKNPGFALATIVTLALGIGANTAIFSLVEGVVLAPLPYAGPNQLVMVWESNPRFARVSISYPNFRDWQREANCFTQIAAARLQGYDLSGAGTPEHVNGREISSGFFRTLGITLALGREFTASEDAGGPPEVILSDGLWAQRFGRSPGVLGKPLELGGVDYTIVGIAPRGFQFFDEADVFTPLGLGDPLIISDRSSHDGMMAIARLKPSVTLEQAQAEMATVQQNLDREYPDSDRDIGTSVAPLKQEVVGDTGRTLLLLLGAVGLVLLIACANVASLQLARATARSREFAVRSALGAGRSRMVQQVLCECVLLALAGGAAGLLLARWGVRLIVAALPAALPRVENIRVNLPVLLFTLLVSIVAGIAFGLAPAFRSARQDVQAALREGGCGATGHYRRGQSTLVVVQVAIAAILLVGSGLLLRAIRDIWAASPGFDVVHVITFRVGAAQGRAMSADAIRATYQQLLDRIRNVPGVQDADFTWLVPLSGEDADMPFWIGAERPVSLQGAPRLLMFSTGPDYLGTMGIPLLRGRYFTAQDTTRSPCVVVIDDVFQRMYFSNSDPLGQTISFGFNPVGPCQIVGVVGHVRHWRIGVPANYTQNEAYFALSQDPDQWVPINYPDTTFVVRTALPYAAVMPAIRQAAYGTGADRPVYDVKAMRDVVADSMAAQRLPMALLSVFALLALAVASVGIYGTISYSVSQRQREIGIRIALGAARGRVFRMVLGEGLRLSLAGLAIGAIAAFVLARATQSFSRLLYGVSAGDPFTFGAVATILAAVALLACYMPARRALKTDPMSALHSE